MEDLRLKLKLGAVVTALVAVVAINWSIFTSDKTAETPSADAFEPGPVAGPQVDVAARSAAETALRTEATVKDVLWTGQVLYVGVLDDGSRRDGYAQYACEVLRENGAADGVTVIVKDIAKLTRGQHVELGKARC